MNRQLLNILTLLCVALPLQATGGQRNSDQKKGGKEMPEFNKEQQDAQRIFMSLKHQKDLAGDLKTLLTNYEAAQKNFADTTQKKFVDDVKASPNWAAIEAANKAEREKREADMQQKMASGEKPTPPAGKEKGGWFQGWFGGGKEPTTTTDGQ